MLFLQGLGAADATTIPAEFQPAIFAAFAAMMGIFLVVMAILWVYMSFAYMALGKKARVSAPGLAWIPGVGPLIIAFKASKMHWWPWLMLLSILVMWIPVLGWIAFIVCMIIFGVYQYIWSWKLFEAVKRPGWWALISLGGAIPFVGFLFSIAYLVLIGIAAWGK